jgi:cytochrome b559 alpha subunit
MLPAESSDQSRQPIEGSRRSLYFGLIAVPALFVAVSMLFIAGWIVVSKGLAYDALGAPRPNEYYAPTRQELPIVQDHFGGNQ